MALIVIFLMACKKNSPTIAVTGITPLAGLQNTAVTITGTGFNAVDSVRFTGITAIINTLTATQMVVTVPAKASTGNITLYSKGMATTYPSVFTVTSFTTTTLPAANGTFKGLVIANIAADAAGNIYCNTNKDTVYKITSSGVKSMLAIAGAGSTILGGTAVDATGNVYTVGTNDFKIYKITPAGAVSVFAGSGVSGFADGQGTATLFTAPAGIAIDAAGNLYVTDVYRVRKITPAGMVSTFAGGGTAGKVDGLGTAATFGAYGNLMNITIDATGNVYVSEGIYNYSPAAVDYIRKITPAGAVTTTAAVPWGGGPALTSLLAVDADGNIFMPQMIYPPYGNSYFSDPINMVNRTGYSSDFYDLSKLSLYGVGATGITFDASGNMYISAAISSGSAIIKFVFK